MNSCILISDNAVNEADHSNLNMFHSLRDLYHKVPADMFINEVLHMHSESEVDLERTRACLFEMLKSNEDYPYGDTMEMKRRVNSRSGDRVSVKLSRNVYSILSAVESAEYSTLKDLLSQSKVKSKKKYSSVSQHDSHLIAGVDPQKCGYKSDIDIIKNSVEALQADVLLLKQRLVAVERTRSEQMSTINATLKQRKDCLCSVTAYVNLHFDEVKQKLSSVPNTEFLQLKNDMCFITENIHKLQTHLVDIVKQLGLSRTEPLAATDSSPYLLNSKSMGDGNRGRLPTRVVGSECHPTHSDEVYELYQSSTKH